MALGLWSKWIEDGCLSLSVCVCVTETVWCFGGAPLISVKAFIVSLVAALMRSFTGGEKREKRRRSLLEKGGVDEIITQLS